MLRTSSDRSNRTKAVSTPPILHLSQFSIRDTIPTLAGISTWEGVQIVEFIRRLSWQPTTVWLIWALSILWVGLFVARYGHNLPTCDEWVYVPNTYASWTERLEWLNERHSEHKFPVGRLVYLCLLDVTGHDFRAGMFFTIALLGASAAALIAAARQLRGRTILADAAFPLLLLHHGHTENLLMGYQIVFTITIFCLSFFALIATRINTASPTRLLLAATALLAIISQGGWLGLVFVPTLSAWIGWQLWKSPQVGVVPRSAIFTVLGMVAAYLAMSFWLLHTLMSGHAVKQDDPTLEMRLRGIADVMGIGLGPGVSFHYSVWKTGCVLMALQTLAAGVLFVLGCRRSEERGTAWGLLAVLLGVWAFSLGIGFGRGSGMASRYCVFTALGIAIPLLAAARFSRGTACSIAMTCIVLLGAYQFYPSNNKHARYQGQALDEHYQSIIADIESGMPIDVLAARHVNFWLHTNTGWQALWDHHFQLVSRLQETYSGQVIPLECKPDGVQKEKNGRLARYRVDLDGQKDVVLIRVRFQADSQIVWEPFRFEWVDPVTGEQRSSTVMPWVRPIKQQTAFWINGPLTSGVLLIGDDRCHVEIEAVEVVVR